MLWRNVMNRFMDRPYRSRKVVAQREAEIKKQKERREKIAKKSGERLNEKVVVTPPSFIRLGEEIAGVSSSDK